MRARSRALEFFGLQLTTGNNREKNTLQQNTGHFVFNFNCTTANCAWLFRNLFGINNMKNKLIDLNDHLFAQLERLGDEDLAGENLSSEIERSKAITSIAKEVISNARLALDAQVALADKGVKTLPGMIEAQ